MLDDGTVFAGITYRLPNNPEEPTQIWRTFRGHDACAQGNAWVEAKLGGSLPMIPTSTRIIALIKQANSPEGLLVLADALQEDPDPVVQDVGVQLGQAVAAGKYVEIVQTTTTSTSTTLTPVYRVLIGQGRAPGSRT